MRTLRNILTWLFALIAFTCFSIAIKYLRAEFSSYAYLQRSLVFSELFVPVVFMLQGLVFSMAFWTSLRGGRSARRWGIAASVLNIIVALFPVVLSVWIDHDLSVLKVMFVPLALVMALGVAGLVVFTRPPEFNRKDDKNEYTVLVKGDGTYVWLNRSAGLLGFALCYGAYSWWARWAWDHHLRTEWNFLLDNVVLFGCLAVVILVHECGHAVGGLSLGMRLRMFAIGPLQWRLEKLKWKFEFTRAMLLRPDGAVGLLPSSSTSPNWYGAFIAAAGPAANLVTGVLALSVATISPPNALLQLHGQLALFGALSVVVAVGNLIPFRFGQYYSDGAHLYQHLTDHPLCDFRRVIQTVMAVSETSLRPRDYDLHAIERSLDLFPEGIQGHYLKLYVFDHCFESGRITEACQALKEAEAIYEASSLNATTEISFVLGYAGLCNDASAARRWWERLDARHADESDGGYWLAKCALAYSEGRQDDGRAALQMANSFIAQLPPTGSRAFDVDWSIRLHGALENAYDAARAVDM